MSASPLVGWDDIAAVAPDGLAVLDCVGRFVRLNPAAAALLRAGAEGDLIGVPSPFTSMEGAAECPRGAAGGPVGRAGGPLGARPRTPT